VTGELVVPFLDAVPDAMCHLIITVLMKMVAANVNEGGALGVKAALASQEAQDLIEHILEGNNDCSHIVDDFFGQDHWSRRNKRYLRLVGGNE
jgi:hypothetical protein